MDDAHMTEGGASHLFLPVGARDHVQGPMGAAVTLLEYGDFECAHCAAAFPHVREVRRWLRGELCYVFRHFPVAEKHSYAFRAAEAAEAAGAQERFWEMHELLCEHGSTLNDLHVTHYAQKLGLDFERFERELRQHVHLEKVRRDFTSGIESGVSDTPTIFINGLRYEGAHDTD
ncbi:MAG TPA: thioredoxin domain-containing protein, partial [Pyrinomonadaceae bacterium]